MSCGRDSLILEIFVHEHLKIEHRSSQQNEKSLSWYVRTKSEIMLKEKFTVSTKGQKLEMKHFEEIVTCRKDHLP